MKPYPPGPDGSFFGLANIMGFKANPLKFLNEVAKKYGDLVYLPMGKEQIYLLNHPTFIRQVFVDDWQKFHKPEVIKASNRGYWGDGLTTLEGVAWRKRRHLMTPAFHQHAITRYAQIIVDYTEQMLARWQPGTIININQEMLTLTARIAARIIFDAELEGYGTTTSNRERSGVIPLDEAIGQDFIVTHDRKKDFPITISRRRAAKKMDTTLKIIQDRLSTIEDRGDMLSFFIAASYEDGSRMTQEEIINELLQMFFAGHLTIPSTLLSLWVALAQNPQVEAQIYSELDQVVKGRSPSIKDLPHLSYGKLGIKEAMRVFPATILFSRKVITTVQIDAYTLAPGDLVWLSPYVLHHDPRNFKHPERFLPERFSQKNKGQMVNNVYFPFGMGPRTCIGNALAMLIIRLILATVAKTYCLIIPPGQNIEPDFFLPLPSVKETYMQVKARSNS